MPYRHSTALGLRYMDYDASVESNALRFPSDGVGGTTATYAGCDIDGYISAIHSITVVTAAAGGTQVLTIEDPDGNAIQTSDVTVGLTAGQSWRPVLQTPGSTTVAGNGTVLNTRNYETGMEIPGGWGISETNVGSNTSKVRIWYSVV